MSSMQGRTTSGSSTSPNARVAPLQIFTNSHYGIPQTSPNTEAYTPLIPPVPRGLTADTNSVHWQHISPHLQGFAPATQNILLNLDTIRNDIGPGNAAWDAAREQVMNSMKSTSDNRGRGTYSGRGRPPTHVRMHPRGALPPTLSAETSPTPIHSNAPTLDSYETPKRGRGRGGRPRGRGRGRGTGRGRGGKRRRDSDDEGAISDPEDDDSENYTPATTTTKSGRNIQRPSQFNPAPSPSSSIGGAKRRRPYRRGLEFTLCVKCQRGHSPASNMIVFCDGCNNAYHQWCHDPHISREAVDIAEQEWFCGTCEADHEGERLPLEQRVSKGSLTEDQQVRYIATLPTQTLRTLLLHAVHLHPSLPLFARDTDTILDKYSHVTNTSAPSANLAGAIKPPSTTTNVSGLYSDYTNLENDPPATYPRPGAGPIKLRPTTELNDLPFLVDEEFAGFGHWYRDDDQPAWDNKGMDNDKRLGHHRNRTGSDKIKANPAGIQGMHAVGLTDSTDAHRMAHRERLRDGSSNINAGSWIQHATNVEKNRDTADNDEDVAHTEKASSDEADDDDKSWH